MGANDVGALALPSPAGKRLIFKAMLGEPHGYWFTGHASSNAALVLPLRAAMNRPDLATAARCFAANAPAAAI